MFYIQDVAQSGGSNCYWILNIETVIVILEHKLLLWLNDENSKAHVGKNHSVFFFIFCAAEYELICCGGKYCSVMYWFRISPLWGSLFSPWKQQCPMLVRTVQLNCWFILVCFRRTSFHHCADARGLSLWPRLGSVCSSPHLKDMALQIFFLE